MVKNLQEIVAVVSGFQRLGTIGNDIVLRIHEFIERPGCRSQSWCEGISRKEEMVLGVPTESVYSYSSPSER